MFRQRCNYITWATLCSWTFWGSFGKAYWLQRIFYFPGFDLILSRVHKKRNNWKNTTLGWEPELIIYYTQTGSSIKPPTQNSEVTLGHVYRGVVYPRSSYKSTLPHNYALHFLWILLYVKNNVNWKFFDLTGPISFPCWLHWNE